MAPHRAVARSARTLAAFDLESAAMAVGVSKRRLLQALRFSASRGVCADRVAAAFAAGRVPARAAAVAHRVCPAPIGRRASGDRSPLVRAAVAGAAGWTGRNAEHPAAPRGAAVGVSGQCRVPESVPACPPAALAAFAQHEHPSLRVVAASNPDCPRSSLLRLAQDDDMHVRSGVAANASCPSGSDLRLAQDNKELVRSSLAYNTACPPNTLTLLAQDKARFVREAVAANPCCPPEVLARLAEDEDRNIRHRVAVHPSCPSEVLTLLAEDEVRRIRYCVAIHSGCSFATLERLTRDKNRLVRAAATQSASSRFL